MPVIKVIKPGFQTTIQDLGRFGYSHLGISISGPADPVSFRIGNILLGNPQTAPALELTLVGGEFEFQHEAIIAITGSNFQPTLNGKPIQLWSTQKVREGEILKFLATQEGARCYLCVQGGFQVDKILGSVSTHLLTKLGGMQGRALIKGDLLQHQSVVKMDFIHRHLKKEIEAELMNRKIIHVTYAPQTDYFSDETLNVFSSSIYTVSEEANRMGLRLDGHSLPRIKANEIITEGVTLGAVQVSHNGKPIILFVEHQTTGGYPKIANVISADIHRVGQLRPRDEIKFHFVTVEEAYKGKLHLESLISEKHFERI